MRYITPGVCVPTGRLGGREKNWLGGLHRSWRAQVPVPHDVAQKADQLLLAISDPGDLDADHFVCSRFQRGPDRDPAERIVTPSAGLRIGTPDALLDRGPVAGAERVTRHPRELRREGEQVVDPYSPERHEFHCAAARTTYAEQPIGFVREI